MGHTNLTYLVGAGASAYTIPTIKNFKKGLAKFKVEFASYLPTEDEIKRNPENEELYAIGGKLSADLDWLINGCKEHASIDTFARKLFLAKRYDEYSKLKFLLSDFLLYRHITHGIDKRYDTFFASILDFGLDRELRLPDEIKIITWNYDRQFEFSLAQFLNGHSNISIEQFANIIPRVGTKSSDYDKFCIVKLNGSYGAFDRVDGGYRSMLIDYQFFKDKADPEERKDVINNILKRYQEQILEKQIIHVPQKTRYPIISYSWEEDDYIIDTRKYALQSTLNTKVLVIIGYSFPTFNRRLDKYLLNNLQSLEKVYIQSPKDTILGVEQRFKSLYQKDVPITLIESTDEFYIPFEF